MKIDIRGVKANITTFSGTIIKCKCGHRPEICQFRSGSYVVFCQHCNSSSRKDPFKKWAVTHWNNIMRNEKTIKNT